ncbi:FAD-dependent monooxygenase [Actinomadura sp. NEAU-AAG7]|uniref:FAD-dependent monooxygenase n=1 Tax=Actinomadura sp. NEAU-AAG7 TaxID=2839640 RepID=UPI001BE3EE84|nr:FAD-dependent monooxygenase [Actinomadura sp. NEAU-AAG7]MBT2206561.1 FAD-dependent monooxygenase [Actinomadura sp. NEAU-AAG7]
MDSTARRTALVSGASIAGPVIAYWLGRHGWDVTLVEKAPAIRDGGYPVDIRGPALDVVRRMGLIERLEALHVDTRQSTFLDADGRPVAVIDTGDLVGGVHGRDLEIPRGELAAALHSAVPDGVELIFDDSIETLHDHDGGVDVTFRGGTRRTFDIVVGADGVHSRTRRLAFGPEERFHRHLGWSFAGFSSSNELGLAHESLIWNTPGRMAALYAPGDGDRVFAILGFSSPSPAVHRDPDAQRAVVAEAFAGLGWRIPGLVEAMRAAGDLFYDSVGQIHMPRWSGGRVALVGDAAYAPSFLSGQGTGIALIGAYVLANELAARPSHTEAFEAYESGLRTFVERNQAIADVSRPVLNPATEEELALRDRALRDPSSIPSGNAVRGANDSYVLPDYPAPAL